jgi:hypothetical protein
MTCGLADLRTLVVRAILGVCGLVHGEHPLARERKVPVMASKTTRPKRVKVKPKRAAAKPYAYALPWEETVFRKTAKQTTRESSPVSYAGKWIGWTPDTRKIVASASTPQKLLALARKAGYPEVILERVPRNLEPVEDKSVS